MKKIINKFLYEYKKKNKKRFDLQSLENYLIDSYKGESFYLANGGYTELYSQMTMLKEKQYIKEIKSSRYNGYHPPLKTKWQIIAAEPISKWNKSKMLQSSDYLDFSYYVNHPSYQTDREWQFIENIYKFLKSRENKEWASIEERSLEIFDDEKFLKNKQETPKGKYGILKRLKLSNEDLKMKKYGEMFIYWNRGVANIKHIIILENHSTFFTYKRAAQTHGDIFGFRPDVLIYGEGKKIENSFSFIEEIADPSKVEILYFGDIDSEGFGIYYRLKEKYAHVNMKLQYKAYEHLISLCKKEYPLDGQKKNQLYLDAFLEEMNPYLDNDDFKKIKFIWDKDFRVPQELINYEYLLKVRR
ncbi:hypothetical protein SAMN05446037_101712 [Anaerovirgula multivorans]|uniref:Wadjet protein JetD C-terminal domain-containing protein n=1 Tax=Anaerovirgula multivorans TaxID=312168 RepID=A0A239GIB5_9FIRM|nr:Wadjet anti-phage system protein JetD domain-containing protein [Anaerovirgula multivorans]SNS68508.1 hypothetical protein SAMN05446037_101712 [Anaerovirgula multivorans]